MDPWRLAKGWLLRQTDGLHLGDAGGEEKRSDSDESHKVRGLYNFKNSSWLTSSPMNGLTIGYMAGKEVKIKLTRQCWLAELEFASSAPEGFREIEFEFGKQICRTFASLSNLKYEGSAFQSY